MERGKKKKLDSLDEDKTKQDRTAAVFSSSVAVNKFQFPVIMELCIVVEYTPTLKTIVGRVFSAAACFQADLCFDWMQRCFCSSVVNNSIDYTDDSEH